MYDFGKVLLFNCFVFSILIINAGVDSYLKVEERGKVTGDNSAEWDYLYSVDGNRVYNVKSRIIVDNMIKCESATYIQEDLNGILPGMYEITKVDTPTACEVS